jgi:hypothetical protein
LSPRRSARLPLTKLRSKEFDSPMRLSCCVILLRSSSRLDKRIRISMLRMTSNDIPN